MNEKILKVLRDTHGDGMCTERLCDVADMIEAVVIAEVVSARISTRIVAVLAKTISGGAFKSDQHRLLARRLLDTTEPVQAIDAALDALEDELQRELTETDR